jgi:hypothetical protein
VPILVKLIAMPVNLGHGQRRDKYIVVDFDKWNVLKKTLDHFGGFFLISGQKPLINTFLRLKHWLITQEYVKEGQLGNVLANHQKAHGQRSCKEQAQRSP